MKNKGHELLCRSRCLHPGDAKTQRQNVAHIKCFQEHFPSRRRCVVRKNTYNGAGGSKLGPTHIFIIEHVILGNDVLNFIDSVIGLGFREGALLAEQGNVERSCTPKLLMENLQVIAKKKRIVLFTFRRNTTTWRNTNDRYLMSHLPKLWSSTYYFPPSRAINSDLCDANEKILWV